MDRTNAMTFIAYINGIAQFVPPVYFNLISASPISRALEQVANGALLCELKPYAAPSAPDAKPQETMADAPETSPAAAPAQLPSASAV